MDFFQPACQSGPFQQARFGLCDDQNTTPAYVDTCRIPDDCIDKNRYPLFMARSVLRELIESLPSTRSL